MKKSIFFLLFSFFSLYAAAEVDPLYPEAERLYKNKQFDSAAIVFNHIVELYPDKKEGYYNRGLSFYHLTRFSTAIADFDRCLEIDSSFIDAQYMKAMALQKRGELKAAIHELENLQHKNSEYDEVEKRIKNYRFAVYLSEKWYYMIAIMLLVLILIAVVAKTMSYRRW